TTKSDEGDNEATESDRESEDEETTEQEEESFDPIPRTPEENRVKFLEDNFSNILGIVNQYMHQQISEAV
nr:hypothetical protein [Tanacetum cinerariifolium]